jgi:alcohol dehydrogenase YqhD (iron-dependent ADH family)
MPTKIFFGKGEIKNLGEEIKKYGKKVLLVYGSGSIKKFGLYDEIMDQMKKAGLQVFEVSGVVPNPRLSSVYEGGKICKKEEIDFILAAGGGSTIDCAKSMAVQARYDGDVWDYFVDHDLTIQDATPLGSILTLSATGSEMNGNAVVTKEEDKDKLYIESPHIVPKFSILDPVYTFSVSRDQTRNGIVDIMVHVIDQYFDHTPNTPLQDRFSESILKVMINIAPTLLENPGDYDARANMMWCGTWALNYAIGYGKDQDWATHDIEHEVSAIYDIAHAVGLAIISPNWAEYVLSEGTEKFVQFAERVWDVKGNGKDDKEIALEGLQKYRKFLKSIGMPLSLKEIGIGSENIPTMAKKATRFGPLGSYKKLTVDDVEKILNMCLEG